MCVVTFIFVIIYLDVLVGLGAKFINSRIVAMLCVKVSIPLNRM